MQSLPNACNPSKARQVLARRIAQRLISIGDHVNCDVDNLTMTDMVESFVTSGSLSFNWSRVVRIYRMLSGLLTQSLDSGTDLEASESWQTFSKLWKIVLQTVVSWIADNGGWVSLLIRQKYFIQ